MAPSIRNVTLEKGAKYTASQLLHGRLDGQHAHANLIKLRVGSWYPFTPLLTPNKAARGFYHLDCGRLLCPASYNWDDPV